MDCYTNNCSDCSNYYCKLPSSQLRSCLYIYLVDWHRYLYGILTGTSTEKCKSFNTKGSYFLAYAKDGLLHANCLCCYNNCRVLSCFKVRFDHFTSSGSILDFCCIGNCCSNVHTRTGHTLAYKPSYIF